MICGRNELGASEVRRASPVDFPFSPVLTPVPACCSVHVLLLSLTMGRRKKKKIPLIPFSQWTPIVQGLNTDASDSGSEAVDPDSAPSMEPIDEEIELNPEDESCPSSNGDSAMPGTSIDDALADGKDSAPLQNSPLEINLMNPNASTSSMDDMGNALEAAIKEIRANPDVPHLDDLRCPIPGNSLDSGLNPSQNLEKLADLAKQTNIHIWRPKRRPRMTAWKRVQTTANPSRDNSSNQEIHNILENVPNDGLINPGIQEPLANTSSATVHGSIATDSSCSTNASTMSPSRTLHEDTAAAHSMPSQPDPLNSPLHVPWNDLHRL
ncbi:hypothetical protein Dimus_004196 [Dionaea muscipula]